MLTPLLFLWLAAAAPAPSALPAKAACNPPAAGNWVVAASCDLVGAATVTGNVTVQPGVTLTLTPGASLNIHFAARHLRVRSGARVVIRNGARIH